MNEDVIPAEHGRGCLGTSLSHWWLLLPLGILVFGASQPFSRITENATRTDSRVFAKGIADAVTQFHGDYARLPVPQSPRPGVDADIDTDTSAGEGLIRILLGKESDSIARQNTSGINYFEGMKTAKVRRKAREAEAKGSNLWIGGLVMSEGDLSAVDAWGGYFRVRLDSNGDGQIVNPNPGEVANGRQKLENRVIVWSAGKDGKWETWEDNVKTWD